ncbi:hypothetical protein Btru_050394 [Bulinus truncatus]|nr:hypothetical protein Btru_050394 [Bulinus truncatus]
MVGRRNSFSVTKRSLRNAESTAGKRPRRIVQSKLVDDTVGLSRQEEQELNKALYASLQENRRSRSLPGTLGNDSSCSSTSNGGPTSSSKSSITSSNKSSSGSTSKSSTRSFKSSKRPFGHRHSLRTGAISNKYHLRQSAILASRAQKSKSLSSLVTSASHSRASTSSTSTSNINLDESSQDSVRSSTSSANGSKRKIHAQRKFAQGCSLPGTPSCTPVKSATPPTKMMSCGIPKTEDFLTFLCLRGSSLLPPHLDFFNYSREELSARDEGARSAPSTASKVKQQQRESTPDSSSTSSGANEEVAEAATLSTPSPSSRGANNSLQAKRSAARASAGTPETARGIVSLRQGLQRKVSTSSSSLARFPVSSRSRLLTVSGLYNCATTALTPRYCNKFYFTPEKPISPSKSSGIRPGEFTPPSLFSSTRSESSYLSKPHTFSPLVRSSSSSKLSSKHSRSESPASRGSSSSSLYSSSSLGYSPGALLRKHQRPDLSSADSTLEVKVTPLRTTASSSSLCCHRLELQDCLHSSTLTTKFMSPPLMPSSPSSSMSAVCSSPHLVSANPSLSTEVGKTGACLNLSEPPPRPPTYKKYSPLISSRLNVLTKVDPVTQIAYPNKNCGLKTVCPNHSTPSAHKSSATDVSSITADLLSSKCCVHSSLTNTNSCNAINEINRANSNPFHCLHNSFCSLHDCTLLNHYSMHPCACPHTKSSSMHECCCPSLKTMCTSKMAHREGLGLTPFCYHNTLCVVPLTNHRSQETAECLGSCQVDLQGIHHAEGNKWRSVSGPKARDAGSSTSCHLASSRTLRNTHIQEESLDCVHHDGQVISNIHQQPARDTSDSVLESNVSVADSVVEDRGSCKVHDRGYHRYQKPGALHCYTINRNNKVPACVSRLQPKSTLRDRVKKTESKEKKRHLVRFKDKTPLLNHNIRRNDTKMSQLDDCCDRQGLLRACSERPGLIRSSNTQPRKHCGSKDKLHGLVRDSSNGSRTSHFTKHNPLLQAHRKSLTKSGVCDFQQEFVKMLIAKGCGRKKPKRSDSSAPEKSSIIDTKNDSCLNQSELTSCNDKTNAGSFEEANQTNGLAGSRSSSSFPVNIQPVPSTMCNAFPHSFHYESPLKSVKRTNIVRLKTPSDEILMLRDQVISAFSKFNRKDVIVSNIRAAKAAEISDVDISNQVTVQCPSIVDRPADKLNVNGKGKISQDNDHFPVMTAATQFSHEMDAVQPQCLEDLPVSAKEPPLQMEQETVSVDDDLLDDSADSSIHASNRWPKGLNKTSPEEKDKTDDVLMTVSELQDSGHTGNPNVPDQADIPLNKAELRPCSPEAALALIGWKTLNKGVVRKRNKQIQTNLCAAVGHCAKSEISDNHKFSSLKSVKSLDVCTSPIFEMEDDNCLCQRELEKHCAKLQKCLCAICKLKYYGSQFTPLKESMSGNDSCVDSKSDKRSPTPDKCNFLQGNLSHNILKNDHYPKHKIDPKPELKSLFNNIERLNTQNKSDEVKSVIATDFIDDKCVKVLERQPLRKCFSKLEPLTGENASRLQVEEDRFEHSLCLDVNDSGLGNPKSSNGIKIKKTGSFESYQRMSKATTSDDIKVIEYPLDSVIDLSLKKRNSDSFGRVDCVSQSEQISTDSPTNSVKIPGTATSRIFVPFDLAEIFEWSIPQSASKAGLCKVNNFDHHTQDVESGHKISQYSGNVRDCGPVARNDPVVTQDKKTVTSSKGSQGTMLNTCSDFQANVTSRVNWMSFENSVSARHDGLVATEVGEMARDSKRRHQTEQFSNCRDEIKKKMINMDSQLTPDVSRKKLNVFSDESSLENHNRQFTNEDLTRLIESVANSVKGKKFYRSNSNLKKESSTRRSRPLVKSRSLDDTGTYLGTGGPQVWNQHHGKTPIVLHSYGSLNTGQGFALVNGELQQCQILNKQLLLSENGPRYDRVSSGGIKRANPHLNLIDSVNTAVNRSASLSVLSQPFLLNNSGATLVDPPRAYPGNLPNNPHCISTGTAAQHDANEISKLFTLTSNIGTISLSSAVNDSPITSNSSSYSSQKIHCLGRSIYLHHDNNTDNFQNRDNHNMPMNYQNLSSDLYQPSNLPVSHLPIENSTSAAFPNDMFFAVNLSCSKAKLHELKNKEATEIARLALSENVDDVVILETEMKNSLELSNAVALQSAFTVPFCSGYNQLVTEVKVSNSSPILCDDESSFDMYANSDSQPLSDEPMDLHISRRDAEKNQALLEEPVLSHKAEPDNNMPENDIAATDLSMSSVLFDQRFYTVEHTHEICDYSTKNFGGGESLSASNIVSHESEPAVKGYPRQMHEDPQSTGGMLETLDLSSKENKGNSCGSYQERALGSNVNKIISNKGLGFNDNLSHVGSDADLYLSDSLTFSHSLKNLQTDDENILEAIMQELQVQITILKEEISKGDTKCSAESVIQHNGKDSLHRSVNPDSSSPSLTHSCGSQLSNSSLQVTSADSHMLVTTNPGELSLLPAPDFQRIYKTKPRSALGAFTPVRVGSHSQHGSPSSSVKSSALRNETRARQEGGSSSSARSARKNLLDKLTSVVMQQSRRPRSESLTKVKVLKQNVKKLDKRVQKKKANPDHKSKKPAPKSLKVIKPKRRISLRLREISKGGVSKISRRQTAVEDKNEYEGGRKGKKQEDSDSSPENKFKGNREVGHKKMKDLKSKGPYKIHPLERVRTRGYSLLLASKLALKRAKKESALVRNKVKPEPSSKEEMAEKSAKKSLLDEMEKPHMNLIKRSQQQQDNPSPEGSVRSGSGNSEDSKKLPASRGKDSVAPRPKEHKDGSASSPKKTPPKKAKLSSSSSGTPPHSIPEDTIPVFHPNEAEFMNPLSFISKIQPIAEPYGMCRIIPPPSWKLDSNRISDDVRFTPQVQQIHRLYKRWGPNVQHTAAINQHLLSENANISTTPQIGGVQIDLPQLYRLVEESGGPKKMSDKKHWARIADVMNIPKQAMDRTVRLYDIYCHHVFPYATLSSDEKHHLEEEVKAIYELQTVEDDAITKGKSMPVSWFSRIARNIQSMWSKDDPTASQVETDYWRIVDERTQHVSVQCGHINTRAQASAFPTRKDSAYSKHPWNLNIIPESPDCLLKYLGPVSGITIPTLHMGMLYSTSCWSSDPHCLPYIQYLHTGVDIIWYCIPKSQRSKFRSAMSELTPTLLSNKPRWLKEDHVMVNPTLLKEHGVKVYRCVHKPRQFVVVFSGAYTATISCGYNISESVHFAVSSKWLPIGMEASLALTKSNERELFSMCALLCGLTQDDKVDAATLTEALPLFSSLVYRELDKRTQLHAAGLRSEKRSVFSDSPPLGSNAKKRFSILENEKVCEICDRICYLSMVLNEQDEQVLCLEHGLKHIQKKKNLKSTRLYLRYNQAELEAMLKNAKDRLTLLTSKADTCPPSSSSLSSTSTISNKSKSYVKQAI